MPHETTDRVAQFTPGPWTRNGQTNLGWRIDGTTDRVGMEFLNNPVAIVPLAADADLIASAPDLLAALEAMLDPDTEGDIDLAMAAIRKAKGIES